MLDGGVKYSGIDRDNFSAGNERDRYSTAAGSKPYFALAAAKNTVQTTTSSCKVGSLSYSYVFQLDGQAG